MVAYPAKKYRVTPDIPKLNNGTGAERGAGREGGGAEGLRGQAHRPQRRDSQTQVTDPKPSGITTDYRLYLYVIL